MKTELSARELAVIRYAAQGHTDDMIANELDIQPGTVNSYWVRIRGKLGNYSRTELVARFVQKNADSHYDELVTQQASDAEAEGRKNKAILDKANTEIQRLNRLLAKSKSREA